MNKYFVGFMFDDNMVSVCMIMKNRPAWQNGFLNGIGGRINENETPIEAMTREFNEETGVSTKAESWVHVCTLRLPYAEIEFFAGRDSLICDAVTTTTDEEVAVYRNIGGRCLLRGEKFYPVVENVPMVLELSRQRLVDREGFAPVSPDCSTGISLPAAAI